MPSILCFGDSLTAGNLPTYYPYRGYLLQSLFAASVSANLAGPNSGSDGVSTGVTSHAGYGLATIGESGAPTENSSNNLWGHLAAITSITPDLVIVCGGVNDINFGEPYASAVGTRITALLNAVAAKWPSAIVLAVAPHQATYWGATPLANWELLKNAMQAWATQSGLKWFTDLNGAGIVDADTTDGLHWKNTGAQKAAATIYNAYQAIYGTGGGTPGVDVTPVKIYGMDVAAILATAKEQSIGSQKANFNAAIAAQLGSSIVMEITVAGVVKYRAQGSTALASSADGVQLPTGLSAPTINVANTIAEANTLLEVRNLDGTKKITVPLALSTSPSANTAKISQPIDGTAVVQSGGFLFTSPTILDAGSTGGGSGDGTVPTLQMFYDQMLADNAGRLAYWNAFQNSGNHSNHESSGVKPGVVAAGAVSRGTSMPQFWKNNGSLLAAFKDNEIWPFYALWAIVSAQADYSDNILGDNLGARIKTGRQIAFAINQQNQIIWLRDTYTGHTWFKADAAQQYYIDGAVTDTPGNEFGGVDCIFDSNTVSFHYLGASGFNSAYSVVNNRMDLSAITGTGSGASGIKFFGFAIQLWIDPTGPKANTAKLLAYVGHDPYPTAYSTVSQEDRPGKSYNANRLLTTTPQWLCTGTLTDARIDFTGPIDEAGISFAALQSIGVTFPT